MIPLSITTDSPLQARNGFMGIYVHYPYCHQKCDYCDFYSEGIGKDPSTNEGLLFDAYKKEFQFRKNNSKSLKECKVDTIFMGGGTPSKASPKHWKELIQFFKEEVDISDTVEISLEANPEDLTHAFIDELYDAGINRLNVGVQTRNEDGLHFLGRHTDSEKYASLSELFSNSKIKRLGIDLMYGIPNLPRSVFESDLDYFLKLNLDHMSLYSLTLEKGTSYSRKVKDHILKAPDEDLQRDILEYLPGKMAEHGYVWYEVSNYAKANAFSRHNLRYWMFESYIGLGPGAHGFLDQARYGNPRNSETYLKNPHKAKLEEASPKTELALSLFRIFLPIEPKSFFDLHLIPTESEQMTMQIEKIHKKGFCDWNGKTFQWKPSALLMLDDLIFELISGD
jgi:oxygen-independent coproporphyrinogen-3 oxidase